MDGGGSTEECGGIGKGEWGGGERRKRAVGGRRLEEGARKKGAWAGCAGGRFAGCASGRLSTQEYTAAISRVIWMRGREGQ